MKTRSLILAGLLIATTFVARAGNDEKDVFTVKGKCGSCEKRIEKAALSVDGVSSAVWDEATQKITVDFDDAKTNRTNIEKAIAKVGHDTEKCKATDEAYEKLPGCCKYNR
ncbi:MAG: heavy-metal-associated domain-containing protein [Mangrovibacterium sp.]